MKLQAAPSHSMCVTRAESGHGIVRTGHWRRSSRLSTVTNRQREQVMQYIPSTEILPLSAREWRLHASHRTKQAPIPRPRYQEGYRALLDRVTRQREREPDFRGDRRASKTQHAEGHEPTTHERPLAEFRERQACLSL